MKVIAIISQKGGVGKTTLTLNLAAAAELTAKGRVAIADIDPQASSFLWYQARKHKNPTPYVVSTLSAGLPDFIERMREAGADYVFIDSAPNEPTEAERTAALADLVIVPCEASYIDILSITRTAKIVADAGKPTFAILNQCPTYGSEPEEAEEALGRLGFTSFLPRIANRAAFRRAYKATETIFEYEPKGLASREVFRAYKAIQKHFKTHAPKTQEERTEPWQKIQSA